VAPDRGPERIRSRAGYSPITRFVNIAVNLGKGTNLKYWPKSPKAYSWFGLRMIATFETVALHRGCQPCRFMSPGSEKSRGALGHRPSRPVVARDVGVAEDIATLASVALHRGVTLVVVYAGGV
jgi:hypothetical protein